MHHLRVVPGDDVIVLGIICGRRKLAQLRDEGLVSAEEFEAKRIDLLSRM